MTSGDLGVGIIGAGSIGMVHAEAIRRTDGLTLVAATGRNSSALVGGAGTADPSELVRRDDVSIVAVCSPSGHHAEHALAALENGKHVVVEKPLATNVADAERVVSCAEERGLTLAVIAQRRLEPQHQYIKSLIASGLLGRPVLGEAFVRWSRDPEYYAAAAWRRENPDGGSLMNQGLHSVDLLRWMMGDVAQVKAFSATRRHSIAAEDTTVAALTFESGALGVIVTSTATRPGDPAELNLYFEAGAIGLRHNEVVRWDLAGVPRPPTSAASGSGATDPGAIGLEGHLAQWADISTAIRTRSQPLVTGRDGLRTVALISAIYGDSGV